MVNHDQSSGSHHHVTRRRLVNQGSCSTCAPDSKWCDADVESVLIDRQCWGLTPQRLCTFDSALNDQHLQLLSRRNCRLTAPDLNLALLKAIGRHVSHQTVRIRLYDANLHSQRPCGAALHTPQHHELRYRWARNHAAWTPQNCHLLLFIALFTWILSFSVLGSP